ncbi:MAG TPA: hypothetical protein DEB40_12260 [Elusimicrobia bacterium]|nr:hypothetical protein [Elusimicrobiota bacterium]HBT62507.1 hypothetical protein [Elusimicrobiota bacterium]
MSPKRIALTALLAAVMAAGGTVLVWRQRPAQPTRPLAKLQVPDLAKIQVDFDQQNLVLEKAAGTWRLTAPLQDEADSAAIDNLAAKLLDISIGSQVAQEASSYSDYELNESSAVRVRIFSRQQAAPLLDGYFGKPAMGTASAYFRHSREPAVYIVEGVEPYLLKRPADELRSRSLMAMGIGELSSLRFEKPSAFTLSKGSATWTAAGRKLSSDQAAQIVLALTTLRLAGFAPAGATELKPAIAFTAVGQDRSVRVLMDKGNAGQRRVSIEGRPAMGLVSQAETDSIFKLLTR